MKHRLSASGIARARRCLWWARGDVELPQRQPSREAALGTALHSAFELQLHGKASIEHLYDDLDDDQIDTFDASLKRWQEWWPSVYETMPSWKAEVAVAWDVKTGKARPLERASHREYGELGDYEVPGTVDAVGYDYNVLAVIDWKTGRQQVESPATNPQLAHNGGAMAALQDMPEVGVTYVKVSPDSVYVAETAMLDVFSFEATRDELRTMLDGIPTSKPVPGPWCQWCPAKGICPETATSVEQVVEASALVRRVPISLTIRDNDHAAGMLTAVDAVENFIAELKTRLRAYADANGGILMPDGTVYSRTDVTSERPDLGVDGADEVLIEAGLQAAIKLSTTWAEIKKLGGKDAEKRVREALKGIGAVRSTTVPRYEAKAKKGKAA